MTTPPATSLPSLLADLRSHAVSSGDGDLQTRVQQLEAALAAGGHTTTGDITGSTAVAVGSNIQVLVQQTNLPPELLARLLDAADWLGRRAAGTLAAAGRHIRVFLSSPGDVRDERHLVLGAIARVQTDPLYKGLTVEAVAWDKPGDHTPLLAGLDPQAAIDQGLPRPSECDIVVVLFWSRLGTPLDAARYRKPDGSPYRSGTEWELDDALRASEAQGRPRVLIYRRVEEPRPGLGAPDLDERVRQWRLVQEFFAGFRNPDGSFKRAYNPYATPTEFAEIFEQDLRKLIAQWLAEKPAPARPPAPPAADRAVPPVRWPADRSPFPGLRAFGPDDAPVFFGRGAETDQLLRRLGDPGCRFLLVVGASGSGKSSLVSAGLIPRLSKGALPGSESWPAITFTPDAWGSGDPLDALTGALAQPLALAPRDLGRRLRAGPAGLRAALEEFLAGAPEWRRVVLFIDQFEEAFTSVTAEAWRQAFFAALEEAARSPRVLLLATLRDDFYRYCVQSPILARLINGSPGSTFTLSAPGAYELYEMLTGPARVAGLQFDSGLAPQILADTGAQPGALAMLAYALDQLYAARSGPGILTWSAYQAFGGVPGAIGTRAQALFAGLPEATRAALARVFRELVEVDESGAATRKRARLERVQRDEASAQLTQALLAARLLVTSRGTQNEALVEVAHEALFQSWPRLKVWIEEAQDDLILLRQVRAAAAWWNSHDRQAAYLWPDERLQPVYQMRGRLTPELNDVEQEFTRPEADRLWDEIERPETSHRRRSFIGERIDTLGDRRPGVGIVRGVLPLRGPTAHPAAAFGLRSGEERLWGDRSEHVGLPDVVWLKVEGGELRIENKSFTIRPFYIAKHPVTYTQFQAFVEAPDGMADQRWWQGLAADEADRRWPDEQQFKYGNHPRENVAWYDAIAFCRWLNARLGWPALPADLASSTLDGYPGLRLLTEWEWQWAATGSRPKHEYPWGPKWNDARANTRESGLGRTTAVGLYPAGAASCGALDMSGNVWEWCLNQFYQVEKLGLPGNAARVVRGGSWFDLPALARPALRGWEYPHLRLGEYGFRLGCRPVSLKSSA